LWMSRETKRRAARGVEGFGVVQVKGEGRRALKVVILNHHTWGIAVPPVRRSCPTHETLAVHRCETGAYFLSFLFGSGMKTVSGRSSFCRKRICADFIRGCLGQGAIAGFAPLTSFALNTGGGGGRHRQTTPHPLTHRRN